MRLSTPVAAFLLILAFTACASPFGKDDGEPSAEPRPELGEPAAPLPTTPTTFVTRPNRGGATTSVGASPTTPATSPVAAAPPATTAPGASFTRIGAATDRTGDAGLQAPSYADVSGLTLEDGGGDVRVTVDMAGDVPSRLGDGEVMGIGVDIFRQGQTVESDYQLFADGSADGWVAYLQTPEGFVDFPGSFAMGGRRLVFTVPWDAFSGLHSGSASVFADWSKRATLVNQTGEDHAPDTGTATFTRS